MEQETWKSFQQVIKEQINLGSVSGSAGECSSPVRKSNTALGKVGVDQEVQPGSVVVNTVEGNSPVRVLSTALDKNISEENYGVSRQRFQWQSLEMRWMMKTLKKVEVLDVQNVQNV